MNRLRWCVIAAITCAAIPAFGAIYTSNGTGGGNWGAVASWSGPPALAPGAGDDVIIQAGDLITLFDTRSVNSVTIQDGGTLRLDGGSTLSVLTAGTSIQIDAPSGAGTSTLLFNGGIASAAGGINVNGSASGNALIDFTAFGGTLTVGTDLLFPFGSNAQVTFNNNGTINIGGNLGANGTITSTNSTFVFNGTGAQSILGSYTFFNLTVNKTNTLTLNNPIWVNGTLFVQNGLFDDGGNQINLNPGVTSTVQINSNGVLKLGSAASGTAFPNPLNPTNVVLASNAAVSYHAGVTQTIRDDFNYKRLFVGNIGAGGVTHLLLGDLVVEEVLDITDGGSGSTVLNIGANPLDVNGDITGTGSLSTTGSQINVGGNWGSGVDFSAGTSNVTYDGSGAQSVRGTAYHSLTIAKSSGTATLGAATTVQNDLTITNGTLSTGGFALDVTDFFNNAGVFDAGSSIVTLNGDVTNSGTFNSSSATLKLNGITTQLVTTSSGISLSTLEINNSNIVTLSGAGMYSVNGTLNLYGGVVTVNGTAGSFFVDVLATVNRTTGWINGYLTMGMNATPARRFHVGTPGVYLPVDVDAGSGGTLTIAALDGQHPDRTADNVLHRYWRLTTPSTVTAIDSLTFNYNAGDVVIGNETLYHLASYNSGTLTFTHYGDVVNEGAHTATAATPVTFLEDWLVGQPGSMAAASKLGITAINGGSNPSAGTPFQVDVQAQDDDGSPTDVFSATTVTLSLDSGTGTLGGTLSGIITGGTDFVTISGVTYDTAEAGVQIRATASLGDDLADATSTFTVDAAPSTLTVTNLNDSGPGSLRAAITSHNSGSCSTPCTIDFSVAGTINLSTALPAISMPDLTIDGFTAPGASANTNAFGVASNAVLTIGISGTAGILTGFEIAESNVVIKGMAIMNFADTGAAGVKITGVNTGSGVSGCHIGVDLTGTTSAPNYDGVLFTGSSSASLGGTSPADRNVISGNSRSGVWITLGSNSITLSGNYVGTNRGLTAALPNADGVYIGAGASAAVGQSGVGNVISGNSDDAIVVTSPGSTIVANLIGPAGNSTTALANGTGIRLESGATSTVIGGASPSETNTISGNTGNGIEILASSCTVDNNRIGIAPDGTTAMGNGASGIRFEDPASDNLIGESFANKIANNGADGVSITGTGIGNVVRENQIFSNTNLAIDLADDGITANDATDSDTGPNNRQNFPTLSAARLNVTNIDVTFSLDSSAAVSANFFRFDVYKADNSVAPQALEWLGDAGCVAGNVFTNQIISVPAGSATVGNKVVVAATAYSDAACTTPSEGTSELSAAATIGGDIHWIAGSGNWETAANWSPAVVPTAADDVFIDAAGTYTVTINTLASARSIDIGTGASGTQTLFISGGQSLTFSDPSSVLSNGVLQLSGTLNGNGSLDVNGTLDWSAGTIAGVAGLNIKTGGTLNINTAGAKLLTQRLLTIDAGGTANWNGGNITLSSGGGIDNNGLFEIKTDATLSDGGSDAGFDNTGTFRKSTTAGTTFFTSVDFNHTGGTIDLQTGTFNPSAGASSAAIAISSGAIFLVDSDTYIFNAGSDASGAGKVQITGGTLNVNGNITLQHVQLDNGFLDGTGAASTGASGTWFWSGGTMSGGGTTQVAGGGTLTISGATVKTLTGRTLSILASGTVNLGGTGNLTMSSGGNINNAGTLDNLSDLTISDGGSDGGINNTSLFRKTGGAGTTFLSGVDLTSSGTIQVQSGTLNPSVVNNSGAITLTGNFVVDSDTVTLSAGSDVSGAGMLQIGGGFLTVDANDVIPNLELSNGTINGTGLLSIGTAGTWSGGTMSGSGITVVSNPATLAITGPSAKSLQRGLTVDSGANLSITGGGTINFGAGSAVTNNGTIQITAGVIVNDAGSGGDITNSGTFEVNASGPVQLSGIALGGAGSLSLLGTSTLNLADGTYSGAITLAAGTSLLIDSDVYTFGGGASVSGSGAVTVSGGQLDVNAAALSITNFTLSNGTLGGTGTLNLPATATWSGGTMSGGGTTSVTPTGMLSITTASPKTLNNRTLSSSAGGAINVTGSGTINLQTAASIANGGTMTLSVDNTFNNAGGAGSIVNTGTFVKTSATGTTLFSALGFTNSGGLVDLQNGILSTNTFTQPSGTLRFKLNGVVAGTQHSQLIISSGTPTFAGTLDITLQGLYQPLGGDTFRVINTTAHLGDFAPYNFPALTGGRTWSSAYDATGLLLTVNGVTDLSVAKSAPFSNVAVGGAIPYSIVVTNNGPDQAQNVTVTDTLAAGHTGINASGTNWNCNVVTLTVTCTATVPLNTGAAPTITINTNAPASPTSFTNIASVSTSTTDTNAGNDQGSWNITVDPNSADVDVSVSTPGAPVPPSTGFTFDFLIKNFGPQTATSVSFSAPIPPELTYNSATPDSGTCNFTSGTVSCNVGNILSGGQVHVIVSLTSTTSTGTHEITGTVSATEGDPVPGNNTITGSVSVTGSTLYVTNTNDLGPGSLAQAITDHANGVCTPLPCTIAFNIPAGPYVISPPSSLPPVLGNVTIDAATQPGYAGVPIVELDGAPFSVGTGFEVTGDNVTIRGLSITGMNTGINISGNFATIEANYIGLDPSGTAAANGTGIVVTGSNNVIGGTVAGERNIISGNSSAGVSIQSTAATNTVSGNYIGTDPSGNLARPNTIGVEIIDGADSNTIGGNTAAHRNIISGNSDYGVFLQGSGGVVIARNVAPDSTDTVDNNNLFFNWIGPAADGTTPLGATNAGVYIGTDVINAAVGQNSQGNVISGHDVGIDVRSDGTLIANNLIGLAPDGITPMGNTTAGIDVQASQSEIGGALAGDANTISQNGTGIRVTSGGANAILANSIHANTGMGIDLGGDGATANDAGDADSGPNGLQNYATATDAALLGAGNVRIAFNIDSGAAAPAIGSIAVDMFESDGAGEGKSFLGTACIAASSFGAGVTFSAPSLAPGDPVVLSATSYTDASCTTVADGTSEFSNTVIAANCTPPAVTITGPATYCTGSPAITLDAGPGFTSYLWSTGATTQTITVSPGTTTNYTVTVEDGIGCPNSDSHLVTVSAPPAVTITGPTSICAGGNVTLDAGGGFASYLWSTGATTQTINVTPGTTTIYSVTVSNGTCSNSDSHTVTVTTAPTVTITGPTTYCTGSPAITLDAGAGFASYLWSTGATTQTISVSPGTTTIYSVTVSDGSCNASDSHTVTVSTPSATITPSGATTFCAGGSVTLTANAGASYLWSNGATTQSINVTTSGIFTVTVTDGAGCSATSAATTVTVNPLPAVAIAGPTATCASSPVTLDAGAGFASYLWSTGATTQTITVSPASTTTYSVTVTNASGCGASDSHTVTVSANPTATISAPAAVCASSAGNSASVAAQAGATYVWSITNGTITGGAGTEAVTFSAGATGNVTLNVAVTTGSCTSNGTANIPISGIPAVTITGPASTCPSTQFTLDAGAGFTTYLWSTGETTRTITRGQSANTQTYSVTVTNAAGCTATDTHTVTLLGNPNANITGPASAPPNTSGLTASVPNQPGATYAWTITNGTITSPANTASITFRTGGSGNTRLSSTVTIGGCVDTDNHNVTIVTSTPADADLAVTKTAPASVNTGASLTYTIGITNNGPGAATGVVIDDTLPAGTTVTSINAGPWSCVQLASGVRCTGGAAAGAASNILITVTAPSQSGTITNTVTVSASTNDPSAANNTASATTSVTQAPPACATAPPSLLSPANGATVTSPVSLSWSAVAGATSYDVWLVANGVTTLAGTTSATSLAVSVPSGTFSWYVVARFTACDPLTSESHSFTVETASNCGTHVAPQLTAPSGGSLTSPVTFAWTPVPQAIGYRVWIEVDGTAAQDVGTTDGAISLTVAVPPGSIVAFVDALFNGCPATRSAPVRFSVREPDPCASRSAATPLSPANNSVVNASSVVFDWNPANDADGYRVWISVDGGTPFVVGTTTEETSLRATLERGTVIWWIEALYDGCASTESQRSMFVIPAAESCASVRPDTIAPANGATVASGNVTFQWTSVPNAVSYEVWLSVGNGTHTLIGSTAQTSLAALVPPGRLAWFVRAFINRCPFVDSQQARFLFTQPAACASNERPAPLSPIDGSQVISPVSFSWTRVAAAVGYDLFVQRGGNDPQLVVSTTANEANGIVLSNGRLRWFVRARFAGDCAPLDSASERLEVVAQPQACAPLAAPILAAPGQISSGVPFLLQWTPIAGATAYQLQIAASADFAGAQTITTTATSHELVRTNDGTTPIAVFARVRALDGRCTPPSTSPYGTAAAMFILPKNAPEGSLPANAGTITFPVVLGPELAGATFTAVPKHPWLSVAPASGIVPAGGITLIVTANTSGLPLGTSLGGITVTLTTPSSGNAASQGTVVLNPGFSVSLVTPVTPTTKSTPPPDALIIPAVAHADGINSHFQSDVRVSNTSAQLMKYELTFTPSGESGITEGKQTSFSVEPGQTIALDDILRSWFGTGSASVTGSLEIRPVTQSTSKTTSEVFSGLSNLVTFASSRTFNVTANGTFGQYIPAVPFASFIGKAADASKRSVLSLQQIAHSSRYRTNLGLLEGSGEPASLLVKIFGNNGVKLAELPVSLTGGQHLQLNSFVAQQGISSLDDGRVEIEVTSEGGRVTAYASVLDNATSDPLLVTPVTLSDAGNTKWVMPGVADLNNGFANWQTDMRVFNGGETDVETTFTFYSQSGGAPKTATFTIPAGQVRQFDRTLSTLFNTANDGGAVHLTTAATARLIATARTYNQTTGGTYGQFISAVTPGEAAGTDTRPLQLLQVEESARFRSNIGLAEVSGNPVTVEIGVVPPDTTFAVFTQLTLAPNEFRQLGSLLRSVGLADTHNARVTVSVVGGNGRVAAYASVIDLQTNDPTYVPAQ